jgi:hypothetical protein
MASCRKREPTKLADQLHISICNVLDREQAQDGRIRLSQLAPRLYRDLLPPQSCMPALSVRPEIPAGTDTSNPHVQRPHFDRLSRSLLRFAVAVAGRTELVENFCWASCRRPVCLVTSTPRCGRRRGDAMRPPPAPSYRLLPTGHRVISESFGFKAQGHPIVCAIWLGHPQRHKVNSRDHGGRTNIAEYPSVHCITKVQIHHA